MKPLRAFEHGTLMRVYTYALSSFFFFLARSGAILERNITARIASRLRFRSSGAASQFGAFER